MKSWTPVAAIAGVTVLESIALLQGMDGALLTMVVGLIAGLGGFEMKAVLDAKESKKTARRRPV